MTVAQITQALDEHGFCVVPSVLSTDQASALRGILDRLREREATPGYDRLGHNRVLHLAAKHRAFVDLMCHPLSMAVCDAYLGCDFVCSTWSSNTALPGADLTYWHVDHPYWTIAAPYPVEPALTAHAIWCLDDFSAANGATKFVPGSHKRAGLPEHEGDYDFESIAIEAPVGSVVFAHGAIWHSAGANTSERPRTAIFGRYARSYIVLQENMKAQLAAIDNPSPLLQRLLGAQQYVPQSGLPY